MNGERLRDLWFPMVLFLLLQTIFIAFDASPVLNGELIGPDSYMRLLRVERLYETGDWFDISIPRTNAPYGETMHWTRPFDVLLMAASWVVAPFTGFTRALYWSGVLISPILQLITLIAVIWAVKPVLQRDRLILLGLMFLVLPGATPYFMAGRADHHGLNLLLFVLSMGFVFRLLLQPFRAGACHALGGIAALSLWVSIESLAALLVNLTALTLFWIFTGRELGKKIFHVSVALFGGLTLALFLERPWDGLLQGEYDRVSIVHWALAGLIWVFWSGAVALQKHTKRPYGRLITVAVGALVAGGVMWVAYPGFFRGPLAEMDSRIAALLFDRIAEIQPLIDPRDIKFGTLIFFLGAALPGLPFLAWIIWKERLRAGHAAWIYTGIGLSFYIPLAFYQRRWTGYPELLLLLPFTELLARMLERASNVRFQALVRAFLISGFAVGFLLLGLIVMKLENGTNETVSASQGCRLSQAARHLDDENGWGDRQRTILASVDFGPELLYRTRHRVVATAYHRHQAGLLTAYGIMSAGNDADALNIIRERRVDLIMLCPNSNEGTFFESGADGPTFYRRLLKGEIPPWLREAPLPPNLSTEFRLYEVIE